MSDLGTCRAAVENAGRVCQQAAARLADFATGDDGRFSVALLDRHQLLAYDLAHASSGVEGSRVMLDYAAAAGGPSAGGPSAGGPSAGGPSAGGPSAGGPSAGGPSAGGPSPGGSSDGRLEERLAALFAAEAIWDLASRVLGREQEWGVSISDLGDALAFAGAQRSPESLEATADAVAADAAAGGRGTGDTHLADEFEMARDVFRRFAAEKVRPLAEHVHRANGDIPEEVIAGLAEIGAFGLSVPEEYGGMALGGESDYLAMVVATEELSWGSLGVGGSLITRPEILTRALVRGGTDEQKQAWLPRIASGEAMVGVMVTEPDYGSDVANIKVTATPTDGGFLINGVKTWATFAGRADTLMLLARTDPDRSKGHRGLSLFIVEKPVAPGHHFSFNQGPAGGRPAGKMEGRAIDTIGYRGMHSFEVAFEDWFVPAANQVGGAPGLGQGFYLQMEGFENGRLQTAARAVGLMQAAFDAALGYARERKVFGQPVFEYQLTKAKVARMAAAVCGGRQFAYQVARRMATGEGALEASMVKAYVCRAAEWVAREALQVHGGMGYAEEFAVSRYFVDARVLSIFEGADETLCLRVIARRLAEEAARR